MTNCIGYGSGLEYLFVETRIPVDKHKLFTSHWKIWSDSAELFKYTSSPMRVSLLYWWGINCEIGSRWYLFLTWNDLRSPRKNSRMIYLLTHVFFLQVLLDLARVIFEEQSNVANLIYKIMMHTQSLLQCSRCQVMLIDDITMVIYLYKYIDILCILYLLLLYISTIHFIFHFFRNYYMYFRRKYIDCAINGWICSKLEWWKLSLSDSCHNFYCIEWNWIMNSLWKKS